MVAAQETRGPGIGIDAFGNPVIDPTKNVGDLVAQHEKMYEALRKAERRYSKLESRRRDQLSDAETRRIDGLAQQRVYYDGIIEQMRSNSLRLLAEQLRENKADSSERIAKLEQFRWETGGKNTATEPMTTEMAASVRNLTGTRAGGQAQVVGWLFAGIAAGAALAVIFGGIKSTATPVNNLVKPAVLMWVN